MKAQLIDTLGIFLLKQGYTVKQLTGTCFDLFARKQQDMLVLKVLEDANSISTEYSDAMKTFSSYIAATPLVIAEKAGQPLLDGVVYARHDIITLNQETFHHAVKQEFPYIKSTQAGLTAAIDATRLQKKREELGMSLHELSKKIGVSSRMMAKYEQGSEMTVNKANKLYHVLGKDVFMSVNIFKHQAIIENEKESTLVRKYDSLGFKAADTSKTPFDIIAKRDKELILTEVSDKTKPDVQSLSRLLDADSLVIFSKKKPKDVPALKRKEFLELQAADELIKFIKQF